MLAVMVEVEVEVRVDVVMSSEDSSSSLSSVASSSVFSPVSSLPSSVSDVGFENQSVVRVATSSSSVGVGSGNKKSSEDVVEIGNSVVNVGGTSMLHSSGMPNSPQRSGCSSNDESSSIISWVRFVMWFGELQGLGC